MPAAAELEAISTEPKTKCCRRCGRTQPISVFRRCRRGDDSRRSVCNSCSATYQRQRREAHRQRDAAKAFAQMARYRDNAGRVIALATAVSQRLGGPNGVAKSLANALADPKTPPATKARVILGVYGLIWCVDGLR